MKIRTIAVAAALTLACGAQSQRDPRFVDTFDSSWLSVSSEEWSLDQSGVVTFVGKAGAADGASSISAPGGVHALSVGTCVLSGMNAAGEGVLELWAFTPGVGLRRTQSHVLPGMDIVGVAYVPASQTLWILDALGNRLVRGAWNGVADLSTVTFVTHADSAQLGVLAESANYTLVFRPNTNTSIWLVEYPRNRSREGFSVDTSSASPQASPLPPTGSSYPAYAIPEASSEGGTSVSVRAAVGVQFQIVRSSTGSVIGAGVGQGGLSVVTVTTSEPLVLGERYSAYVPGAGSSSAYEFRCVRRYGTSEVLSDGTSMMPFFYQRGAVSGSIFNIQLALQSPAQAIERAYDCYLLVAFRAPSDPVVPFGNNFLLASSVIIPATAWIPAGHSNGSVSVDVPIPEGFGGLVFLVQYAVADGGQWKVSQIYGSAVD
jgi:hypothetical protein